MCQKNNWSSISYRTSPIYLFNYLIFLDYGYAYQNFQLNESQTLMVTKYSFSVVTNLKYFKVVLIFSGGWVGGDVRVYGIKVIAIF